MWLLRPTAVLLAATVLPGCLHEAPNTADGTLDGECAETAEGMACITLAFEMGGTAFRNAPGDLQGDLHWGLYDDGTVSGTGPNEPSVAGTFVPDVDLSDPDTIIEIAVPNMEPGRYQALGYLDDDGDGESSNGDPVTLPSEGFNAPADQETRVQIFLDYIR
jgi:hypothetical protein